MQTGFVDIHCHLLPGIDDGAADWQTSLDMARMAVDDGIGTVIVTPHQLGNFSQNRGGEIRHLAEQMQHVLREHQIPLRVLPGADVRIEDGMIDQLLSGEVLTLGDLHRHVLLELPHELYFPMEGVLSNLEKRGLEGILSHPERNKGIQRDPELLLGLVDCGCLMQVTAGSLMGTFGPTAQQLAEWMLSEGLVHFIATDAHGVKARRPLMRRAFDRVAQLVDEPTAQDLCIRYPALVAHKQQVPEGRRAAAPRKGWRKMFTRSKAG